MMLYRLPDKKTLLFTKRACEFLRAYTTNVPEAPRNAFVDIRGMIIAVFDQKKLNDNEVLAVIEERYFVRLTGHLEKYLSLGVTRMDETGHLAYFDLEGNARIEYEFDISQKKGRVLLSLKEISSDVLEESFTRFRVNNNIPVQGVDYDREMILNVGDEEFVSYTKGCYLGQEVVSRVHHSGKAPRKLVTKRERDCTAEEQRRMTSRVPDEAGRDRIGFVWTKSFDKFLRPE